MSEAAWPDVPDMHKAVKGKTGRKLKREEVAHRGEPNQDRPRRRKKRKRK